MTIEKTENGGLTLSLTPDEVQCIKQCAKVVHEKPPHYWTVRGSSTAFLLIENIVNVE